MPKLQVLGPEHLDALHDICERSLPDPPARDELEGALFDPADPALVRGDPSSGFVATVRHEDSGWIRLLCVDPRARRQGNGQALIAAAEADLAGVRSITVGADPPYFLYPGVETSQTAMLCLLERQRYERQEANFNMSVDLDTIPGDPGGWEDAQPEDRPEIDAWMAQHWAHWRAEALRALDHASLVLARDGAGIAAFCAYDVNRRGLLGPVAVRGDLYARGAGRPVILGALHRMRQAGRRHAEVVWVGPVFPYARVGAQVSRVFFVYRKSIGPSA